MENRLSKLEKNMELLNIEMAVSNDRYARMIKGMDELKEDVDRIDGIIRNVESDMKVLLHRTSRMEQLFDEKFGDKHRGGKLKGIAGSAVALVVGGISLILERRWV